MEVCSVVQKMVIKTTPNKKKHKKEKWLLEEVLQIVEKEEKQKANEKRKDISIRGQTEWKAQSQKTNQNDHVDHSFV